MTVTKIRQFDETCPSTYTPIDLLTLPDRSALQKAFVGKSISTIRTPAIILDRSRFKQNCHKMAKTCMDRGIKRYRCHVKTHKTGPGVRIQLEEAQTSAIVTSTLMECWQVIKEGLVADGLVKDMLYGLPVGLDKLEDLRLLAGIMEQHDGILRLMVDNVGQIKALKRRQLGSGRPWSIFIKVDGGGRRAGLPPLTADMRELVSYALESSHVQIHGFYSHFGQSYASVGMDEAAQYLHGELTCVSQAAQIALELEGTRDGRESYVLSVGATPTAHALGRFLDTGFPGEVELHAGNYCCLDLQQVATGMIKKEDVANTVLTHVISDYPHRSEAMCDAGGIAMARDAGPYEGFGHVVSPVEAQGWILGRMSQEHGILVRGEGCVGDLQLGQRLRIIGQHACVTLAAHPWYYCVDDGGDTITDIWVPWKGW